MRAEGASGSGREGGPVHVKALKMEGVETFEGKDAAVAKGD